MVYALYTLIQSSVYADNNKQYTNANFDTNIEDNITSGGGPGGGGTTYGLKSFVDAKSNFVTNQLDCATLLNVTDINPASVNIFPNPVSNLLKIEWEETTINRLAIFDVLGKQLYHISIEDGQTNLEMNFSEFSAGMYFIQLSTNYRNVCKKVIKE